jgi:hypothetical protein
MDALEWSQHANNVAQERRIPEDWAFRAIESPDRSEIADDGLWHYVKAIPEHGGRFLRVIVNRNVSPNRIVTLFFDRRLGRTQ